MSDPPVTELKAIHQAIQDCYDSIMPGQRVNFPPRTTSRTVYALGVLTAHLHTATKILAEEIHRQEQEARGVAEVRPIRVALTEEDYIALVSGQSVKRPEVEIILSDIGFGRMMTAIRLAMMPHDEAP